MKHLISLKEQTKEELLEILKIAKLLKNNPKNLKDLPEIGQNPCTGKKITLLFEKTSTRTMLSFWYASLELGAFPAFMNMSQSNFAISNFDDEIKTVMLYSDLLMYRALDSKKVTTAVSQNIVPVIDGCSNKYHPSQAISDIFTMAEISGGIEKVKKVVWLGIENNVSNTLVLACLKLGVHVYIVSPLVDPDSEDEELKKMFNDSKFVHRTLDLKVALENADYVHTDTWLNMEFFENGKIKKEFTVDFEKRKSLLIPFQLSNELLEKYNCQAKIMHCMPCHEGYEITSDAIEHPNSVIFKQAENRLHAEKGMLWWLLSEKKIT